MSTHYYDRTSEQQEQLGFLSEKNGDEASAAQTEGPVIVGTTNGNEHSTEEKQRYTPAGTTKLPHGSVGAERAHRAIAEGSSAEIAATLFKYSAPEEVGLSCPSNQEIIEQILQFALIYRYRFTHRIFIDRS